MQDFSTKVIIFGGCLFALAMGIAAIEEKFPVLKDKKPIKWITEALFALILLCIPVLVVSLFIEYANAPSAYELCMQGTENATDPELIAYMEDYCYESNSG